MAVAIEMDELPACDLPGAVHGDGDQGVAAGVIADRSRIGRGVWVYGMARSMPRYRCATFHVLKTPVSFIGLSSSRRITVFLEANIYQHIRQMLLAKLCTLRRRSSAGRDRSDGPTRLVVSAIDASTDLAGNAAGGRKLIAVVHADMVGYSRLIGLDDGGTLARLRTLRANVIDPSVAEHGGRIVQTGGDSLLILFDSIDGAVRGAVKMQQQIPILDGDQPPDQAIRFRIGIDIGDVIADGTDFHGDGVIIATRLQANRLQVASASPRGVPTIFTIGFVSTLRSWATPSEEYRPAHRGVCTPNRSRSQAAVS